MRKKDWAFTEDGDLDLGSPKVNDQGQILYLHKDGSIDIYQGEDGVEIRDIAYVYGLDVDKQLIINRLKTDAPDWFHHPNMGGNLSDLIGEPNTRATAELGAKLIMDALTYRNAYNPMQINIRPVPVSESEIMFMINISKEGGQIIQLPLIFNLQHGLLSEYVGSSHHHS